MKKSTLEASKTQKFISFLIAILVLVASGFIFSSENIAFYKVAPHPYIVASIVLSSLYGFLFAFNFSVTLSLVYLSLLHFQTDYKSVDTILNLDYLTLPILMILISVVLGELKTRSILHIRSVEKDLNESGTSNDVLLKKVKDLSASNYDLKKKLLNKLDTFKSVLSLTRGFQSLKYPELIDFYFDTTQSEVNARSAGFYHLNEDGISLSLIRFSGSRQLPEKISLDRLDDDLIQLSLDSRGTVSIRDLYRSNDSTLAREGQSLLCSPTYLNDELFGIMVIYDLPFLDYVPSNFALLEILTHWFERSIAYAYKFSLLTTNSIFNNQLEVYTYQYFREKVIEDFEAAKRYKIESFILTVTIDSAVQQSDANRKLVAQVLKTNTRKTDIITEGLNENTFCLLVPFTDNAQIEALRVKLLNAFSHHHASEKLQDILSVSITSSSLEEACVDHDIIGEINA